MSMGTPRSRVLNIIHLEKSIALMAHDESLKALHNDWSAARQYFRQVTGDFFGTGTIVLVLKHDGMIALLRVG